MHDPATRRPGRRVRRGTTNGSLLTLTLVTAVVVSLPVPESLCAELANADHGREVLRTRGCLGCHAVDGDGAGSAADLGRRSIANTYTPASMAAQMWNHAPTMFGAMADADMNVPALDPTEADDLFAFFWRQRYFDLRGEAGRGKGLFSSKGCVDCHGDARSPGPSTSAPPVREWSSLMDAVEISQSFWNHGREMAKRYAAENRRWPTFTEQEMVDLLIYVRNLPDNRWKERPLRIPTTNADGGAFRTKGCVQCHGLPGSGATSIDLAPEAAEYATLIGFATGLWNHAPDMAQRAEQEGRTLAQLTVDDVAEIISCLWSAGAFEEAGNATRGAKIFDKKGCASCHQSGDAPDLRKAEGRYSAPRIASAVFMHGPGMLADLKARGKKWPRLSGRDMADIIAYLNRRS